MKLRIIQPKKKDAQIKTLKTKIRKLRAQCRETKAELARVAAKLIIQERNIDLIVKERLKLYVSRAETAEIELGRIRGYMEMGNQTEVV